jgi:helix-turn-helix protein
LCARGLLTTDGAAAVDRAAGPAPGAEPGAAADGVLGLTPAGRAVLDTIEAHTDERAWTGGLAALGEQGIEEVIALLRPSVRAVVASGMLPPVNPTGLNPS